MKPIRKSSSNFNNIILEAFKELDSMPLRASRILMNKADYDDITQWGRQHECSLCHIFIDDLQLHCTEIGDNEHVILSVHSL